MFGINQQEKTIIAQATPKGSGAIALIRISGFTAIEIADQISKIKNKKLSEVPTRTIHYGHIFDDNEIIDQVMLIVMKAPNTFTGEDVIEITCHNNPFIIDKIIELAISKGARIAQQGEFTKRAFLNGKIDLLQAESINDLIHSNTQIALKKNLSQLEGSFSNWILKIEEKLLKSLVLCEASFEFLDDEIEFGSQIIDEINSLTSEIKKIKQTFNNKQQIKDGIRIALIGSVNAGKSSLFNLLLGKNRSIVSNLAGTTRDSVEAGVYNNDFYMTLIDTAGLRQTDDIIEIEGIKRSHEEAQKADIILLVFDGSRNLTEKEKEIYNNIIEKYSSKIISILNKVDLKKEFGHQVSENIIEISTKNNLNIHLLNEKIKEKVNNLLEKLDSPFLLNQRQFNLLLDLENKLSDIKKLLSQQSIEYELLSIHINEAIQSICELTGKNISEKTMDAIFKEFCVGK